MCAYALVLHSGEWVCKSNVRVKATLPSISQPDPGSRLSKAQSWLLLISSPAITTSLVT